jgi:uncharacterized protein YodC (DUF2158 family)
MPYEQFQPGDLIYLKSGSPAMTVISVDGDDIKCEYFDKNDGLLTAHFPAVAISKDKPATQS